MSDDASYNTFLAKANQDPRSGGTNQPQSTSQARSKFDPTTPSETLPAPLRNLPNVQYVSDTDSEFEPVLFSYASDALPSVAEFQQVCARAGIEGEIEELSIADFDPRGEYTEIVQRVREVSGSAESNRGSGPQQGVKVFRVQVTTTRVEYYILAVGERKLVGVVAKAVES